MAQNKLDRDALISEAVAFVKETLRDAEKGHDWLHIERVWNNALYIGNAEETVDMLIVELGALLHDIADAKFHNGDEEKGPQTARAFLVSEGVDEAIIEKVENIVRYISFKGSIGAETTYTSPELSVVQDADRLDALGAIGIARAFTYGGFKSRPLYDPMQKPNLHMTKEEYKNSHGTTINHFYEKLLLLKDMMNTKTGKELAEERDAYMRGFLKRFLAEWDGGK